MSTHETTRRPAKRKRRPNYRPVIFLALVCAAIFAAGYCVGVRAADKAAPTLQEPVQESTSTPEPTHEPSEVPSTEEVLWRDDIVTDGNLLDYDLQVTMQACCEEYGVPYALALAVADVESRFDPDATSNTNDYGLMQINTNADAVHIGGSGIDRKNKLPYCPYVMIYDKQKFVDPRGAAPPGCVG